MRNFYSMIILANKYNVVGIRDSTETEERMKRTKRVIGLLLVAVLLTGILPMSRQTVQAAGPYMKKLNVKWDLKKNKVVFIQEPYDGLKGKKGIHDGCFSGYGKRKTKVKLTSYKIKNKGNKKKLTFTVNFEMGWTPNKTEIHHMANSDSCWETGLIGGGKYFTLIDYKTGLCLENTKNKKKFNITIKGGKFKGSNKKWYKDDDGCKVYFYRKSKVKVTVTYPKDYKNLCIVVGGLNVTGEGYADIMADFWDGDVPFGKVSYYKKGRKNSHWIRVK